MALIWYKDWVKTYAGKSIAGAPIELRRSSDNSWVTLYTDGGGATKLDNPFKSNEDGSFEFYAEPGQYTLYIGASRIPVPVNLVDGRDQVTFSSRSEFVAWISNGGTAEPGTVEGDGIVQYVASPGATALPGMPGWLPFGAVYADHFGENTTPGTTDMTSAIQAAVTYCLNAQDLHFRSGRTYLMGAVTIPGSLNVVGNGATILRPANFDQNNVSELTAGLAHLDVTSGGVRVTVRGLVFDGNEANQAAADPRGMSIRFADQSGAATGSSEIIVEGCTFVDQTQYAVMASGLTESNERQAVIVRGCTFLDGRKGIGSGDPASANANGLTPFYIQLTDHLDAIVENNVFRFRKTLAATAEYAPCAVRVTFLGATVNADGASVIVSGNVFDRIGRKDADYLGNPTGNNGLGVVDFYGRGREAVVSDNKFDSCYNSAVRGKTNIDGISVTGNMIEATPLSINIGPATFESQLGAVVISGNTITDADQFAIGCVGNNALTTTWVQNISITGNAIRTVTNVDGATGNVGGILVRYAKTCAISGNTITDASGIGISGITARNMETVTISGNTIATAASLGIYCNGVADRALVSGNNIEGAGFWGIGIDSTTAASDISVTGNMIDGAVDYGILPISTVGHLNITGNTALSISGLSRGIYIPATITVATVSANISDATSPLFNASTGALVKEWGNSWNPSHDFLGSAPATGTWAVGDLVWATTPTAGGKIGWVCVTAGTPGTWKAWGAIDP